MIERWIKKDGTKYTWLETLQSMCNVYGTFCGAWHSNVFWAATKKRIPLMSEKEAEEKIRQIEAETKASIEFWRQAQ